MDSISQMEDVHQWQNQRLNIITDKEKIPQNCRIGGTCFTYFAIVGEKQFTNNSNNMDHVHKEKNYLVSSIITFGVNFDGGETIFNGGIREYNLGRRAHLLKHVSGIFIVG